MKFTLRLAVALALFFSLSFDQARADFTLKVIVYGDSITAGQQLQSNETYAAKLGYKLKEVGYNNVEVINMSQNNQTSISAYDGIGDVLFKRPDVVVVQLGNNEMLRGVNTDVIYRNIGNVIGSLQQKGIYVVLIGVKAAENLPKPYARQLEDSFSRLVAFYKVAFYPDALAGISGNPEMTLADGYYPNSKAIDFIVENSYILVDAGLRWRWSLISQEQAANTGADGEKIALPPAMPLNVEPQPQQRPQ